MFFKRILENFKLLLFQSNNQVESKDGVSAAVKRSISPTNEEKHSEKKLKSANEVNLLKIYFSLLLWQCLEAACQAVLRAGIECLLETGERYSRASRSSIEKYLIH